MSTNTNMPEKPSTPLPGPSMSWGSNTGLVGVGGAWVAAITAAVSAGSDFYQDNGVVALFITAVAGTLAFLGARSSQANAIIKKGTEVHDVIEARYNDLLDQYEAILGQHVAEIEAGQDALPSEIRDEVVTAGDPEADSADTSAPQG